MGSLCRWGGSCLGFHLQTPGLARGSAHSSARRPAFHREEGLEEAQLRFAQEPKDNLETQPLCPQTLLLLCRSFRETLLGALLGAGCASAGMQQRPVPGCGSAELTARGSRLGADQGSPGSVLRRGGSAKLGLQALGAHSLPGRGDHTTWLSFLQGETIVSLGLCTHSHTALQTGVSLSPLSSLHLP